jgi:ribulose-phosphate 3-epimerase
MNKRLAPSILAADFAEMKKALHLAEQAGLYYAHLDVMDGDFVPPITFGSQMVAALRSYSRLFFDVHLMTRRVERHIDSFAAAGADSICFHYEAEIHHNRLIAHIKDAGCNVGISLVPSTPIIMLEEVLPLVDYVLVMSVNPGYGGQPFLTSSYNRIKKLNELRRQYDLGFHIQVDGGVTPQNAAHLYTAGADVLVAGSALYTSDFTASARAFEAAIPK